MVSIRLTVDHKTAKKFSLKAKKIDKSSPLVVKKFTEIFFPGDNNGKTSTVSCKLTKI